MSRMSLTSRADRIFSNGIYQTGSGKFVPASTVKSVIKIAEELADLTPSLLLGLAKAPVRQPLEGLLKEYFDKNHKGLIYESGLLRDGVREVFADIVKPNTNSHKGVRVDSSRYEAQSSRIEGKYGEVFTEGEFKAHSKKKFKSADVTNVVSVLRRLQFAGERARVQAHFNELGIEQSGKGVEIYNATQNALRELYESTIVVGSSIPEAKEMSSETREWCLRACQNDEQRAFFQTGHYSPELVAVVIHAIRIDGVTEDAARDRLVVAAPAFDTHFMDKAESLHCVAGCDKTNGNYTLQIG